MSSSQEPERPGETPEAGVEQFRSGDPEAFAQLYERWGDPVFRYLVHIVGFSGAAEDLFQDTWMKVMQRREQLRDHERFGPWIFRIARNLAFNEMRKSRRKARVWILSNLAWEGEESECLFDRIPHPAQNPLERTIDGERRQIIQQAIAELDALTQEMLQLRYFEQFSLVEIAEALHVPLGTVCTKIHRGLKAVQRKLKDQGIHALDEI